MKGDFPLAQIAEPMTWFRSISAWLNETHTYSEERITNGESLIVLSLLLAVGIGMAYLLYRQLFPAGRVNRRRLLNLTMRQKRWPIVIGVSCGVAVAGVILLSNIISPFPEIRQPPAEINRVVHPSGFSIVKPGGMRAEVQAAASEGDDAINILPDGGRSRYAPILNVRHLHEPAEQTKLEREGYQVGVFQGQQALIYKGKSGKYDACRIMMHRGGEWYEVALLIPEGASEASSPSAEWMRYLETFRLSEFTMTTRPADADR